MKDFIETKNGLLRKGLEKSINRNTYKGIGRPRKNDYMLTAAVYEERQKQRNKSVSIVKIAKVKAKQKKPSSNWLVKAVKAIWFSLFLMYFFQTVTVRVPQEVEKPTVERSYHANYNK